MRDVRIALTTRIRLSALSHIGAYNAIGRTFEELRAAAGPAGLFADTTRLVGVYYDEPEKTPEPQLRSAAGLTIDENVPVPQGFEEILLAPGRHAILQHIGPYSKLQSAYRWLFGVWLPASGEKSADRPCFEIYLNDPARTPPQELLTEIHIPLA